MRETQSKSKSGKKYLFILLSAITIVAIIITIWALFFREKSSVLTPDYAPQQTEGNQTPIEGDDSRKMQAPSGGGAVSLTYTKEVNIDLSDKKASLLFANPGKSTQDMVLQLVIQDSVVIQSGRLTPGNQVTTLDLLKDTEKLLTVGGYEGKFVILYYNRQSGEKAMVNTEIPVTVSVTD